MYRKYITFEGNREREYIHVQYEQWLESNNVEIQKEYKSYFVKDIPATDTLPAIPMFSEGWMKRKIKATSNGLMIGGVIIAPLDTEVNFGEDIIVGSINTTLVDMAFDVENGHIVTP